MFLEAFIYPERLSLGVSLISNEIRYAIVYRSKSDKLHLISSGKGIPVWLRYIVPLLVHTDFSKIPVIIKTEQIGPEDPDVWIERREESTLNGKPEDLNIVTEYVADGSTVYQVCVSSKERDELIERLMKNFEVHTLSAPLWKLATLYWEKKQQPFLLWKISKDGSVLGRVNKNRVEKICNIWPDTDDLYEKPDQILDEITPLICSLCSEKLPVIIYSPEKEFSIPAPFCKSELKFENPPEINGVLQQDHETYALACHKDGDLNFVPFEKIQKNKHFKSIWNCSIIFTRWFVVIAIVSLLVMLGIDKGADIYVRLNSTKLTGVKEQIGELKKTYTKRDSVIVQFKEKARFIADESKITNLLSDFQDIFPEGMKAEEITIIDTEDKSYQIDIRTIASTSGLIGIFIEKLRGIQGITGCRMIYSEQIPVKQGDKGIRVKIQAFWR